VITFVTGFNQYAIVICPYTVMAVSRNGFFLFERVWFAAAIKFPCYTELGGGVHARKIRITGLYNKQHTGLVMFM
jgi:hypothetical protein